MDTTNNPYQTPSGQLTDDNQGFGEIKYFSSDTRIGRLRYLAHGFLMMLAALVVLGVGAGLAVGVSEIFWVLFAAGYLAIIVFSFILMIQRLHDLNHTGWMCLLAFIPLVGFFFTLYIIFAPGTKGPNNYGLQPPPNETWHWIFGLIGPIFGGVAMVGMMAAIAIPAYQDYVERANSSYSSEYNQTEESDSYDSYYDDSYEDDAGDEE